MRSDIQEFKITVAPGLFVDMASVQPGVGDDTLGGYTLLDFSLDEEMMKPHVLRFTMRRNNFPKTEELLKFSLASSLLGKDISCRVVTIDDQAAPRHSTLTFLGKITRASMKGMTISCEASSSDGDYDGTPKSRCFCNKKISEILNLVIPGETVRIHTCFNNLKFPYIVQYNENDYEFIKRLAKRFGAFLYFNGANLVFGKPDKSAPLTLASSDFASLQFDIKTGGPNIKFVGHDYKKNVDLTSTPTDFNRNTVGVGHTGGHLFASAVAGSDDFDASWKFFIDDPNGLHCDPVPATTHFDAYNKAIISSYSSDLVTCSFLTYRLDVQVGSIVKLDQKVKTVVAGVPNEVPVENGTLFVTSAHISWDCNGEPKNEVTAFVLPESSTAEDDIFAPYMDYNSYPKSSAQRAEVFNNVDPEKMGRVQVFFSWQKDLTDAEKAELPWIRIAQPYTGKDKGFYVIPETKEEVMVGFEHDNMEKPFVIGSLYHNSDDDKQKHIPADDWCEVAAAGGNQAKNEENEVKAFRTKNGHTIEFHDTKQGDGFIRIYGNEAKKPNYDIILSTDVIKTGDSHDQDYEVESASVDKDEGFDKYKVDKLRIMVCSNGGDIVLDAGAGDIVMNAQNIRFHAKGDRTAYVEGNDVIKIKEKHHIETKISNIVVDDKRTIYVENEDNWQLSKVEIDVSDSINVTSKTLSSSSSDKTEFKAASIVAGADNDIKIKANSGLELNGGTQTDLKGTNVNVEADVSNIVKGEVVSVEGKGTTNIKANAMLLDVETGVRKGTWTDM